MECIFLRDLIVYKYTNMELLVKKKKKREREMGQYKTSLLHLGEEFCFRIHISEAGI